MSKIFKKNWSEKKEMAKFDKWYERIFRRNLKRSDRELKKRLHEMEKSDSMKK